MIQTPVKDYCRGIIDDIIRYYTGALPGSPALDGMPHGSGGISDPVFEAVARRIEDSDRIQIIAEALETVTKHDEDQNETMKYLLQYIDHPYMITHLREYGVPETISEKRFRKKIEKIYKRVENKLQEKQMNIDQERG